ncbi:hypothetical protein ACP6PL_29030 [Dapis sp. BLCC M126]|uniref:hypothetical protein n=1 Tax=Dapis sp. BLCC M126 TaxID=3400189 RepID=UPI003CFA4DEF
MSNNDREDRIQVNFQLARSKWERLQVKCKDNCASISEVLQLLVELYLAEKINNYQTILSVALETKIDAEIGKYIGNKLDNYIDKYIEKKLIQGIKKIDNAEELVTNKDNDKLINIGNKSEILIDKYQDEKILITEIIDKKEVNKNQFNDEGKELKTARELAELFGCSPAYITTLNRLGDLEKRGWIDSGKRQGKAILYQHI